MVLGATARGVRSVAIAMGPDGGFVAVVDDAGLRLLPVDAGGRPRGEGQLAADLRDGHIFAFRRVRERWVVLLRGSCATGPCLMPQVFDQEGRFVTGGVTSAPIADRVTVKSAVAGAQLLVALGHESAPPDLHRIGVADGLGIVRSALPARPETRTEVLALAGEDDGRWAIIYRVGAAEGHGSAVRLAVVDEEVRDVEALHDALAIESVRFGSAGLEVVASFEFSRPRYMTLAVGEGTDSEPLLVPPGAMPAPFEGARRALLRTSAGALSVDIETGAGDPVARRLVVAENGAASAPAPADVARSDDDFIIATVVDEGIVTRRVHCTE